MVGSIVLAAALSGAAAWACIRSPPAAVLRRRLGRPSTAAASHPSVSVGLDVKPALGPPSVDPAVGPALGSVLVPRVSMPQLGRWLQTLRRWAGNRRGRELTARRAATVELCVVLADELRAGRLPADALLVGEQAGYPLVPHAAEAVRRGDPVAPALLRDARHQGAEGLRLIAACWSVAEQHGGALATALNRVASILRAHELARRRVALELAAPRATARLLAALPVLGLIIGSVSGADPIGVLIGTAWGWGLLAAGLGLDLAGLVWVGRIARAAERSG